MMTDPNLPADGKQQSYQGWLEELKESDPDMAERWAEFEDEQKQEHRETNVNDRVLDMLEGILSKEPTALDDGDARYCVYCGGDEYLGEGDGLQIEHDPECPWLRIWIAFPARQQAATND